MPLLQPSTGQPDVHKLAALLTVIRPDTVLSHHTAAALHGIPTPPSADVEVTTPATWRGSAWTTSVQRRAVRAHRQRLDNHDVARAQGLPVTSLERTWLDLAASLELLDLIAAGDAVLRLGADHSTLHERVRSSSGMRGVRKAALAVRLLNGRSRSRPESRIRGALLLNGLPAPRVNEPVYDGSRGWLAEPDLHYREAKIILEFNGSDHADVARMRRDATRLLDLQRAGWTVRTYTAADAFARLDGVVADVRLLLAARTQSSNARPGAESTGGPAAGDLTTSHPAVE